MIVMIKQNNPRWFIEIGKGFSFSVITIEKRLMEIWLSENLNKLKKRVNTIWIY